MPGWDLGQCLGVAFGILLTLAGPARAERYETSFESSEGFTTGQGPDGSGGIDLQPTTVSGIWWHAPGYGDKVQDQEVQTLYSHSGTQAYRFSNLQQDPGREMMYAVQLYEAAGEAAASTSGSTQSFVPNQHGESYSDPVPTARTMDRAFVGYWWRTVATMSDPRFSMQGGMSDLGGHSMTHITFEAGFGGLRLKVRGYSYDPNVLDSDNVVYDKYVGLVWGQWYYLTEELVFTDRDPNGVPVEDTVHYTVREADPNGRPGEVVWHTLMPSGEAEYFHFNPDYSPVAVDTYAWASQYLGSGVETQRGLGLVVDDFTFMTTISGDITGDGVVDLGDLGVLAGNWGSTNACWLAGDMNQDLNVDLTDVGILAGNWGATGLQASVPADASLSLHALPEPASLALMSVGSFALLLRRRR